MGTFLAKNGLTLCPIQRLLDREFLFAMLSILYDVNEWGRFVIAPYTLLKKCTDPETPPVLHSTILMFAPVQSQENNRTYRNCAAHS